MQQVVEVSRQDRADVKRALRLRGSITRMQEGTGLSRQAIVNVRDLGRCEQNTLRKIKEYLAQKEALAV